jgi:Coenzyme PQQ synthesis protein D (PqqD)
LTTGRDARQAATPGHHARGTLQPAPDVVAQRVGDEVIIVNLRTNRMHSLNRTGARFWDLLTTGHDIARIYAQLLSEFDVDPVELDREIDTIVASLTKAGLVQTERA